VKAPIVSRSHGSVAVRFPGTAYIPGRIDEARYITGLSGSASALVVDGAVVVTIDPH